MEELKKGFSEGKWEVKEEDVAELEKCVGGVRCSADTVKSILKDECAFCFDDHESDGGLFISLTTFIAADERHLKFLCQFPSNQEGQLVFLNIAKDREYCIAATVEGDKEATTGRLSAAVPTKLAIGVEGGFPAGARPRYEFIWKMRLCVVSDEATIIRSIPLPDIRENDTKNEKLLHNYMNSIAEAGIPRPIVQSIVSYIKHSGMPSIRSDGHTWEDEPLQESTWAATLPQIPAPPHIPNSGWSCDVCGATKNLWMNLSDGYIGCGRKQYDGMGGGCQGGREGAAVFHYQENLSFPLAVKLGTITAHGHADVFSYEENDMVVDPLLPQHLEHFGISIQTAEKTEKTINEMQIEYNLNRDWSRITEDGSELSLLNGAGYIGLKNLGNTCYMNAVIQLFAQIPEVLEKYASDAAREEIPLSVISQKSLQRVHEDELLQFAKLCQGLTDVRYPKKRQWLEAKYASQLQRIQLQNPADATHSSPEGESDYLCPSMFRHVIVKSHSEFSSSGQQDAEEFLRYFLEKLSHQERNLYTFAPKTASSGVPRTPNLFRMKMQNKLTDMQSKQVRLSTEDQIIFQLRIPFQQVKDTCTALRKPNDFTTSESLQQSPNKKPRMSFECGQSHNEGDVDFSSCDVTSNVQQNVVHQAESVTADSQSDRKSSTSGIKSVADDSENLPAAISFEDCLATWWAEQSVSGFLSPITKQKGEAKRLSRFLSFPPYLILQMKRFYAAEDWTARKIYNPIQMPDVFDLREYRWAGLSPDEVEMQADGNACDDSDGDRRGDLSSIDTQMTNDTPLVVVPDDTIISAIVSIGFSANAAKHACIACNNSTVENCVEWLMTRLDDPTINDDPLQQQQRNTMAASNRCPSGTSKVAVDLNSDGAAMLLSMGFTTDQVAAALKATNNDPNRAADWLFSHSDDLDAAVQSQTAAEQTTNSKSIANENSTSSSYFDGEGVYDLMGIISHVGKNANCGHYVAHFLREDTTGNKRWVLYNDCKVAESQDPPKQFGYLYLYRRRDHPSSNNNPQPTRSL